MKSNYDVLGNYIRLIDTRNKDNVTNKVMGINIDKFFMPSVANVIGTDLSKYKLITKGKFACNPMHVGRDERLPVALYGEDDPVLVSPAYFMFEIIDNNVLDENYLMMWFRRAEFDLKRKINDNLLATTQAIYKSWFVDFDPFGGAFPQNWLNGCVEDIAEFYDSMRKPLSSLERADMERLYPYYGAVSIVDYVEDFIFDGEYLLVSEDGIYVVDENGHPLLQHIAGKFWVNNHAHILKGKAGFNEDSLYLFLANTNMAPIVTGAAQPKINQANLKSFPITIPNSDVIEKFNALIQPFFDQRLSNEAEVKNLENLKELLLSRLVN